MRKLYQLLVSLIVFGAATSFGQSSLFTDSDPLLDSPRKITRLPVPPLTERQKSLALVNELYSARIGDTSSSAVSRLSSLMLEQGVKLSDDPPGRFVLFEESKNYAIKAKDLNATLRSVRALSMYFEVDGLSEDQIALGRLAAGEGSTERLDAIALSEIRLIDEAVRVSRSDIAEDGITLLDLLVAKPISSKTKPLIEAKILSARSRAKLLNDNRTDPENPATNLALGQAYCAIDGNWDLGLPLLAKSADESLKRAATIDLQAAEKKATPADAADVWWSVRPTMAEPMKLAAAKRSGYWYQQALVSATGLQRALVEKRLQELKPLLPNGAATKPSEAITAAADKPVRSVFLVDASGSMMSMLWSVKENCLTQIASLDPPQAFNVAAFSGNDVIKFKETGLVVASPTARSDTAKWFASLKAAGTTDPTRAVEWSFSQRPDALYVFTDGFDQIQNVDAIVRRFSELNRLKRTKVHVYYVGRDAQSESRTAMERIASESGGTFKIVSR